MIEIISNHTMTNADKIRQMTDEDLAKFLTEFSACKHCDYMNEERDTCGCPTGFVCTKNYAEAIIGDWMRRTKGGME